MTEPREDVYSRVTNRIIADLEKGVRTWERPWSADNTSGNIIRPLRSTGEPYKGVNILLLWGAAIENGYQTAHWFTYKQASALGAQVRKGEKGSMVVYADRFTKTEQNDKGEDVERAIPFMKAYTVFNAEQIDGLPAHFLVKPEPAKPVERLTHAEAFLDATGATVRHGGNKAFYAPSQDIIQLPPRESFVSQESYISTRAHETTHWTSHPTRLNRELGKRFGDHAYAAEELIAEMGAAFLCADLAIKPQERDDHAAYIGHWLTVLKADKRAIFTAASQAQAAADYIHSFSAPKPEPTPPTADLTGQPSAASPAAPNGEPSPTPPDPEATAQRFIQRHQATLQGLAQK